MRKKPAPVPLVLKKYVGKKARGNGKKNGTITGEYSSTLPPQYYDCQKKSQEMHGMGTCRQSTLRKEMMLLCYHSSGSIGEDTGVRCSTMQQPLRCPGLEKEMAKQKNCEAQIHRDNAIESVINNVFNIFCTYLARTQISNNDCFLLCTITRHDLTMDMYLF